MVKPDGIVWGSQFPAYINESTLTGTFTISGTLPAGSAQSFSVNLSYPAGSKWMDIYLANNVTGNKMSAIGTGTPVGAYQYTNSGWDTSFIFIDFGTGASGNYHAGVVNIGISISNSGNPNPLTLITQTVTVTVPVYNIPL